MPSADADSCRWETVVRTCLIDVADKTKQIDVRNAQIQLAKVINIVQQVHSAVRMNRLTYHTRTTPC